MPVAAKSFLFVLSGFPAGVAFIISASYISLKMKDILLHNAGTALILSEMIMYDLIVEPGLGHPAVTSFGVVLLHQYFLNPGVYGKGISMVQSEKADAVGYLFDDSVETGEIANGLFLGHFL